MPTPVSRVAEYLLDELAVTQPGDDARGGPFRLLIGAIGVALGRLPDLVRDTDDGPGWSSLLDPDRCPAWALPWLAQFAGVRLTPAASETQQRAQITSPPAFERGTPGGMRAAVQEHLTDTKLVRLIERNGSPYQLLVITRTSETPDPVAAEAAARSQKPAGLILTFQVSNAPLIDEATLTIDGVAATVTIDAAVLGDV